MSAIIPQSPPGLRERVHIRFGAERPRTDANGAVGKGSNGAVDVGAQCRPGRMAMSNAWSRMPPISAAGSASLRKLSVPTRRL